MVEICCLFFDKESNWVTFAGEFVMLEEFSKKKQDSKLVCVCVCVKVCVRASEQEIS